MLRDKMTNKKILRAMLYMMSVLSHLSFSTLESCVNDEANLCQEQS